MAEQFVETAGPYQSTLQSLDVITGKHLTKIFRGTITLVAGLATIDLPTAIAFTSSSTYTVSPSIAKATAVAEALTVEYVSATQFKIRSENAASVEIVRWLAEGY